MNIKQKLDNYYSRHPKSSLVKLREDVVKYLGHRCAWCGWSDYTEAIEIDHINGDGRQDIPDARARYESILSGNHSKEVQLLCSNCNKIKAKVNEEYKSRISAKTKLYIKELCLDGIKAAEIARQVHVSKRSVHRILKAWELI